MVAAVFIQAILWGYFSYLTLEFQYHHHPDQRPILIFVGLWLLMFVVFFFASRSLSKNPKHWKLILLSGILFRLFLVPTNPVQEDDFYRYLWDGAVLAQGVNPYFFTPAEVIEVQNHQKLKEAEKNFENLETAQNLYLDLCVLLRLAPRVRINELHYDPSWNPQGDFDKSSIPILDRVNHPHYPTVYPPLSQAFFALSAFLKMGSLWTLRLLFVALEVLTLFFLVKTLRALNINVSQVAWYAWNPLVIKEYINSPHIDVLMTCCLAGFFWSWSQGWDTRSFISLSLGVLSKWTTLLFFPFIVLWSRRYVLGLTLALLVIFSGLSLFSSAGESQWESLRIMGTTFKMNAPILDLIGRYGLVSLAGVWLVVMLWFSKNLKDPQQQLIRLGLVLAGVLLLSPVANPWYFGILMLFLPLKPRISFVVIGAMLGLYYLRFYFLYHFETEQAEQLFSKAVCIEWVGILLVITYDFWLHIKCQKTINL